MAKTEKKSVSAESECRRATRVCGCDAIDLSTKNPQSTNSIIPRFRFHCHLPAAPIARIATINLHKRLHKMCVPA